LKNYTEHRVWWGKLSAGDHMEDPGLEWRIILKWIFDKWDGGIDWFDLDQNRDKWRAVVNTVMSR
jgi:hypothetical protein